MLTDSCCLDSTIFLCDFQWERWLNTLSNGYRDVKDIVLGLVRKITDSQTKGEYEMILERLFCNNVWLDETNEKLRSWISNKWLPCYKVGFYLKVH